MRRPVPGRRGQAAIVAALSLALAGCAGEPGGRPAGPGAPLAVLLATQATGVAADAAHSASRPRTATRGPASRPPRTASRAMRPSSGHPAIAAASTVLRATPIAPRRSRGASPARALAASAARRLAAPACATYLDALAGRYPDAVIARGAGRALAVVTASTAAALLGMPIDPPHASATARGRLDAALGRLSDALAETGDDAPAAAAATTHARLRAYAGALGIRNCA